MSIQALDALLLSRGEVRKCVGCGMDFVPRSRQQLRCKHMCNVSHHTGEKPKSRAGQKRNPPKITFVGLDGEGIETPTGHEYVLLSVGDQSLRTGSRLSTEEIFTFLWEQYMRKRNAIFVGFSLGYDFSQWLKDLDVESARELLTPAGIEARNSKTGFRRQPVYWSHWRLDMLANKQLRLLDANYASAGWLYINDVYPFFQKSFLKSIDPKSWPIPVASEDEYAIIKEGKERRATATLDADMIRYNVCENTVLVRMMTRLDDGFRNFDVKLSRSQWYGPGQAAQAWMDNISAPTCHELNREVIQQAHEAARKAYYGGWFEIFAHGLVPDVSYEYDINSAYPYIISTLPCLMHGSWELDNKWSAKESHKRLPIMEPYTLVYGEVHGVNPICGAMLHRRPDGTILRPQNTTGWYWLPELEAAYAAGLIKSMRIFRSITYHPCDCDPPYASIANLYSERLAVGKNTPQGVGLKLVYNSSYGKMAQSVGKPKYANGVYASLITSGCRRMILEAIGTHPNGVNDLLMVATDGVYFRSQHSSLPLSGDTLGSWEESTKSNLTLFMPGVYWDDTARSAVAAGEIPSVKSRGVSPRDIASQMGRLDKLWSEWNPSRPWPYIELPIEFRLVTPKQALQRNKWELCGTVDREAMRRTDSNPCSKRRVWRDGKGKVPTSTVVFDESIGGWRSAPYFICDPRESTPYRKQFAYALEVSGDEDSLLIEEDYWNG